MVLRTWLYLWLCLFCCGTYIFKVDRVGRNPEHSASYWRLYRTVLWNEPRSSIFRGSAGPQPLKVSLSLVMTEFSLKNFALFMWWRVFEAYSQICYLTDTTYLMSVWRSGCSQIEKTAIGGRVWLFYLNPSIEAKGTWGDNSKTLFIMWNKNHGPNIKQELKFAKPRKFFILKGICREKFFLASFITIASRKKLAVKKLFIKIFISAERGNKSFQQEESHAAIHSAKICS